MTDWTTCRVVRDGKGRLRTDDGPIRGLVGDGLVSAESAAAYEHMLGPLVPVLDADGQPVVHTVGDLTARHLRRDISVEGMRTATLLAMRQSPRGQPLPLVAFLARIDGTIGTTDYYPLDTPCAVVA